MCHLAVLVEIKAYKLTVVLAKETLQKRSAVLRLSSGWIVASRARVAGQSHKGIA